MKKIIVFLADGFEECEGLVTVDLLRRAGADVITASIMGRHQVTGAHDIVVAADTIAEDVDYSSADMIVLPGGGIGTRNLSENSIVKEQCLRFAADKWVAAICAAPTVLGKYGILQGKKATCYPGCEQGMLGAEAVAEDTVTDGNIITGRAPGAAIPFALEIIRQLYGQKTADKIKTEIVY